MIENSPKSVDVTLAVLDPLPMEEAFGGIDEAALDTYRLFLTSTAALLADIGQYLLTGDLQAVIELAHSAKGAAKMTGACRLAAVFGNVELCCKADDRQTALEWAALLPQAFGEVGQAIDAL